MPLKAIQQIHLGTVLGSADAARATLADLVAMGYEGIELNSFMIQPTPLLVRALTRAAGMPAGRGGRLDWPALVKDSGLAVVALHSDLGSIEREPGEVAHRAAELGTATVVITGMYRFDYAGLDSVRDLAHRLDAAGSALARSGVRLLYHNHNAEFVRVADGRLSYEVLLDETSPEALAFEVDVYWPTVAGTDPVELLERVGRRLVLLHVTDRGIRPQKSFLTPVAKPDSVELGEGTMPMEAILRRAVDAGVEAVIVETHRNWVDGSPLASARVSARYLDRHL